MVDMVAAALPYNSASYSLEDLTFALRQVRLLHLDCTAPCCVGRPAALQASSALVELTLLRLPPAGGLGLGMAAGWGRAIRGRGMHGE